MPTQATFAASNVHALGKSFCIFEWQGSGPPYSHVHYSDDEAWHVLQGTLTFHLGDEMVEAPAGTTVHIPAGVPHSYEVSEDSRYLIILTPRLRDLIEELHQTPFSNHAEVMKKYDSDILP